MKKTVLTILMATLTASTMFAVSTFAADYSGEDPQLKKNIKIFIHDKKEGHKIQKWLSDLPSHKYLAIVHKDIELYDSKYKTNIVISKYLNTKDSWIIVTNKDVEHAIQNYSHRFG